MKVPNIKTSVAIVGALASFVVVTDYISIKFQKPPVTLQSTELPPPTPKELKLRKATETEQVVLDFIVDVGITDKNAVATVLGNIKQESRFDTYVCEGGKRTGYRGCHKGGFGLIQWTTFGRYNGLGKYARSRNADPNNLQIQLEYMLTERPWKRAVETFKTPGKTIDSYMDAAHIWLGWGVHGARTNYAHDYADRLYWG
jgi:hypothetical protein|tara:strand:+ start:3150 stop:3749 length:600 start_codon:yes stop_codon:yes gene_type:complete